MWTSGGFVVNDVFRPGIVQAGSGLVPADHPFSAEVFSRNDLFAPVAIDIVQGDADIEVAQADDAPF
jgi:hypothetical protein